MPGKQIVSTRPRVLKSARPEGEVDKSGDIGGVINCKGCGFKCRTGTEFVEHKKLSQGKEHREEGGTKKKSSIQGGPTVQHIPEYLPLPGLAHHSTAGRQELSSLVESFQEEPEIFQQHLLQQ